MPRTGRGGKRQGTPGATYTNRTDLNHAPRAVPGQEYGAAGAQLEAQRAVPLPTAGGGVAAPGPQPGSLGAFDRATDRPNEPVTTGLARGPGAGPEVLGQSASNPVSTELRAIYLAFPNEDLRRLIESMEQ